MKDSNLFWYLTNVDLFQGLNAADLRELSALVDERVCQKKQILYSPHDAPQDIYILKKGEITLYASKDGKRLVLNVLGPNSIFGRLSTIPHEVDHFAEVTEDAYVCTIPLDKFSRLIARKPNILMNLLNILSKQVHLYQEKLKETLLSAEEKVLAYLGSEHAVHRKLTHIKIADQIGLSRETVSRIVSRLKKEGKL